MKLDSKWNESILETSDIFLALLVGIVFEKAIESVVLLVFEIEIIVAAIAIGTAFVLKKRKSAVYGRFRNVVLRGARWVVGVWAALLFTIGYSLTVLFWPAGIVISAAAFAFVTSLVHYYKIVEGRPSDEQREIIAKA